MQPIVVLVNFIKIKGGNSMNVYDQPADRPGCATVYAILQWLGGAAYIVGALFVFASGLGNQDTAVFSLFTAVCLGLAAVIPIVTGIGVWKMRLWGWWIVIILHSLAAVLYILSLLGSLLLTTESTDPISLVCGSGVGLAITGYILYWFITNRGLFAGATQTVVGPDGEIITKSSGMDTAAVVAIVGVVAIVCVIPIVTIAILTLLGPQIGNVFSRITAGLGTPVP